MVRRAATRFFQSLLFQSLCGRAAGSVAVAMAALVAPAMAASGAPPDFSTLRSAAMTPDAAPFSTAAAEAMAAVPGGDYRIGRDDAAADQAPAHLVALSPFKIDRTEVTNAAFAEYLNALSLDVRSDFLAGAFQPSDADGSARELLREGRRSSGLYPIIALDDDEARIQHRDGQFEATPGFEQHPVAETTWAGARGYCDWRGARLPTEAEWEAAARGADARAYPWGDEQPDPTRAFVSGRTAETAVVGERPAGASPVGALDMSGSLAEWTSSLKRPYPYDALDGREDPEAAGERVTRGGDYRFDMSPATLTASHRNGFSNAPERGHRHIGFRCAVSIAEG